METASSLINEAILALGSGSKLARACGVTQPAIRKAQKVNRVSPRLAKAIEAATDGAIAKWKLCPEVFEQPTA